MKIGIMTFWWSKDNYGQLLQCYALQNFLRNLGLDAFTIRYNWSTDIKKTPFIFRILKSLNPFLLFKYFAYKKRVSGVKKEQSVNDRGFDSFRDRYLVFSEKRYLSYTDLRDSPPDADVYIVGSDQVWNYWADNPKRFFNQIHSYFLDFGSKETKRFSYAASWGRVVLPVKYIKTVTPLLSVFNYISVREETGLSLCKQCGRSDVEWVCDPVFLLDAESYRSIYRENDIRKPNKKYLLLYMLNNKCDFDIQKVYGFAGTKSLDVVYVTGNGLIDSHTKYFATIPEWLYLIDNAEYVITNSFHGSAFCCIFHKQFGVIPLSGKDVVMNARFDSLFSLWQMEQRYINSNDFSILDKHYSLPMIDFSEKLKYSIENFCGKIR